MQLQNNKFQIARDEGTTRADDLGNPIDFDRLLGMARRQSSVVIASTIVGACVGVIVITLSRPLYTAEMSVMMDRSNDALVSQLSNIASIVEDESSVLSQVELFKSEAVGMGVVNRYKLDENPMFVSGQTGSLLGRLKSSVAGLIGLSPDEDTAPPETEDQKRQEALVTLMNNVDVQRVGRSYVLDIRYTAPDPQMAATIANAFGEAYIEDKLDAKFQATQRASNWMQERIDELRQKAIDTDLAVQKFRTANNLVSTGEVLLSDQQLAELNTALIGARADTARAKAQYDRITNVLKSGDPQAIVSDALANPAINDLRKRYLDASKREAEIAASLGENHQQAQRLRGEMAEYQRLMFSELGRIAEGYKSELEVAETREKSLTDSVSQASTTSSSANETLVQLRELQREADTYRNLYQSFLDRYQQAISQQSFPITDARVISRATAPIRPSAPKKPLLLAMFTAFGLMVGGGIGMLREFRDRFFRTGEQIREELGMECLGIAPLLADAAKPAKANPASLPANTMRKRSAIADYVLDHPLSAFAEALRSAKIATDVSNPGAPCKIIGVISTLPGEGKSTISTNLAELLAAQGARTLLIDADLRNPGATRLLAGHAQAGLLEVLLEGRPVDDLLQINPRTGLAFLPAVIKQRIPHSSEIINSDRMHQVLQQASTRYNYIVLDLPPIAPVVDARAIAARLDSTLMVVEWGRTARRAVRQALASEPDLADKCVGAILNKVDMDKMKLYRAYGSLDFYQSRYSRYYQES